VCSRSEFDQQTAQWEWPRIEAMLYCNGVGRRGARVQLLRVGNGSCRIVRSALVSQTGRSKKDMERNPFECLLIPKASKLIDDHAHRLLSGIRDDHQACDLS